MSEDFPSCEGWTCQSCGADNFIPSGFARMSEHTAEIDVAALIREAYRLGYQDLAHERDFDPGHALDLLADIRITPPEEGQPMSDHTAENDAPIDEGDYVLLSARIARTNSEQAFIEFLSMKGPFSVRVPLSELTRVTPPGEEQP